MIPKGQSGTANRRVERAMAKRKKNDLQQKKILHSKLKIDHDEPYKTGEQNSELNGYRKSYTTSMEMFPMRTKETFLKWISHP